MKQPHVIGVISDTHGLLRPEAVEARVASRRGTPDALEAMSGSVERRGLATTSLEYTKSAASDETKNSATVLNQGE
jgi:hypothetical protein